VNIDNLLDREPPDLATNANVYDFLGRRYRIGVRLQY
jgi:outer membrane receptor protein involved in Fe transport